MPHTLTRRLTDLAQGALDWVYPPHCHGCSVPVGTATGRVLCVDCYRHLRALRIRETVCEVCGLPLLGTAPDISAQCLNCRLRAPHFDHARAIFEYAGPPGRLIVDLKFRREFHLARWLIDWAWRAGWMPLDPARCDAVVPVPLHRRRLRERGYNQAGMLADALARHARLPVVADALVRTRHTDRQTSLSARRRWENVKGAFGPGVASLEGQRVLLVDDVMTTGATASECASVLKRAGVTQVHVFTLARSMP